MYLFFSLWTLKLVILLVIFSILISLYYQQRINTILVSEFTENLAPPCIIDSSTLKLISLSISSLMLNCVLIKGNALKINNFLIWRNYVTFASLYILGHLSHSIHLPFYSLWPVGFLSKNYSKNYKNSELYSMLQQSIRLETYWRTSNSTTKWRTDLKYVNFL